MSHFKSLTQMQVRLIHIRIQVSPTGLERILQAWAGVPMYTYRDAHVGVVLGFHGGFEVEVFQVDRDKFGFRCGDDAV